MSKRRVAIALPLTDPQRARIATANPDAEIAWWPEGIPTGDDDEVARARLSVFRGVEALVTFRISAGAREDLARLAPALRWIQFSSAGVEPATVQSLAHHGIRVSTASGVHAIQIAEYALSAILLLAKGWPAIVRGQSDHQWMKPPAREIYGATLCVVGLGRVGGAVARMAAGLGMRVIGVRRRTGASVGALVGPIAQPLALAVESGPTPTGPEIERLYGSDEVEPALGEADFVLDALPSTPETESFFNARRFAAMRDGAYFINIGRGNSVDDQAIATSLASGKLAGAVLDVFRTEPLPVDSPLWDVPNLVVSPHISGLSPRYMDRAAELFAENIRRFLADEPLLNVVDPARGY